MAHPNHTFEPGDRLRYHGTFSGNVHNGRPAVVTHVRDGGLVVDFPAHNGLGAMPHHAISSTHFTHEEQSAP